MPARLGVAATGYDFELFSQGFEWRDMDPVTVVQTVAGDESIDVSDTSELQVGGTYAIYSGTGVAYPVTVSAVLSPVRLRASEVLSVSLSGATLARTSWDVRAGYAVAKNGGVFYSRPVRSLRYYGDGRVVIRRDDSDGTLGLQYRVAGTSGAWQDATLLGTVARAENTRDEEYRVVGGSLVEFRLEMANGPSARDMTVFHMVAFPGDTAGRAWDVAQPVNLSPVNGATSLNDTVPLGAAAYRSLYGMPRTSRSSGWRPRPRWHQRRVLAAVGSASNTHTIPAGNLAVDTGYFWQLRYQDADGTWSPWSEPTAFTTGSVFQHIQQPTNTAPAAGTTSASVLPTLQASAFTVIGGTDTHAASQWQVRHRQRLHRNRARYRRDLVQQDQSRGPGRHPAGSDRLFLPGPLQGGRTRLVAILQPDRLQHPGGAGGTDQHRAGERGDRRGGGADPPDLGVLHSRRRRHPRQVAVPGGDGQRLRNHHL